MNKQITLSAFNDELAKVRTKKKEFLAQMDRIIPWGEWKALIQPYYYKGERGNKPYELELICFLGKKHVSIFQFENEAELARDFANA